MRLRGRQQISKSWIIKKGATKTRENVTKLKEKDH